MGAGVSVAVIAATLQNYYAQGKLPPKNWQWMSSQRKSALRKKQIVD
jgi:hypothetical protein